jgi:hypothetical protein
MNITRRNLLFSALALPVAAAGAIALPTAPVFDVSKMRTRTFCGVCEHQISGEHALGHAWGCPAQEHAFAYSELYIRQLDADFASVDIRGSRYNCPSTWMHYRGTPAHLAKLIHWWPQATVYRAPRETESLSGFGIPELTPNKGPEPLRCYGRWTGYIETSGEIKLVLAWRDLQFPKSLT